MCKDKTKKWHKKHTMHREFEPGQAIHVLKSRLKIFPKKLKPRWSGPFELVWATRHGDVEHRDPNNSGTFLVNGQIVKHYWGGNVHRHKTLIDLVDA